MSEPEDRAEQLLEIIADELYIERWEKEEGTGEGKPKWRAERQRLENKIEGLRDGLGLDK